MKVFTVTSNSYHEHPYEEYEILHGIAADTLTALGIVEKAIGSRFTDNDRAVIEPAFDRRRLVDYHEVRWERTYYPPKGREPYTSVQDTYYIMPVEVQGFRFDNHELHLQARRDYEAAERDAGGRGL